MMTDADVIFNLYGDVSKWMQEAESANRKLDAVQRERDELKEALMKILESGFELSGGGEAVFHSWQTRVDEEMIPRTFMKEAERKFVEKENLC